MIKEWVDFKIEHAHKIIAKNRRGQEEWVSPDFVDKWFKAWDGSLIASTFIVDGEPIACIGFALQEWNKAEAWTLFTEGFDKHILTIYRKIRSALKVAFAQYGLVRIQATIDPINQRWIESLGFEYEGILRRYGPENQDYLMYSMVA